MNNFDVSVWVFFDLYRLKYTYTNTSFIVGQMSFSKFHLDLRLFVSINKVLVEF